MGFEGGLVALDRVLAVEEVARVPREHAPVRLGARQRLLAPLAREHEAIITVEEGAMGGFGGFVLQALAQHGALDRGLKVRTLCLPDIFQDQDKPDAMYAQAGLDAEGILRGALSALGMDNVSAAGAGRRA